MSAVPKAEVVHAVREEMAQNLADVVFRRTDLGTGRHPGEAALMQCAKLTASELGWDESRLRQELAEVNGAYPAHVYMNYRSAECQAQQTPFSPARVVEGG